MLNTSIRRGYIIRFDDFYSGMQRNAFHKAVDLIDRHRVPALLGVVPAWTDKSFDDHPRAEDSVDADQFWSTLVRLQAAGCEMAVHGYDHLVRPSRSYLDVNPYGELSERSFEDQLDRLQKGRAVLESHGLRVRALMPPAHSYDANTLQAMRKAGYTIITDGKYLYPQSVAGIVHIPQLDAMPRRRESGIVCCCLHPQWFSDRDFREIDTFLGANKDVIISIDDVMRYHASQPALHRVVNSGAWLAYRTLRFVRRTKRQFASD